MFSELALRNVKRQMGNYLIYFMTVALTVALLFSVNQVIFCEELVRKAKSTAELGAGLTGMVVFISLIVAFVLSYATSFMLKLRKREFGTYLTLGMTRRDVLRLFIAETVIICLTALGAGMGVGVFLFQGLMAIVAKLMEVEPGIWQYSVKGLVFTAALVAGIFLLSTFASSVYLKRVSIHDLVHGGKKTQKACRHPFIWGIVTVISLGVMVWSCVYFYREMENIILRGEQLDGVIKALLTFGGSLVLFHIGAAKSVVLLLLGCKRLCCRGTFLFVLRQLSGALGSNAMMIGALAFLLTFSAIGANISFTEKASQESALIHDCPYDIIYADRTDDGISVSGREIRKAVEQYVRIEKEYPYSIYTTGKSDFYGVTDYYEGLPDRFMSVSEFNSLCVPLGYEPVKLQEEFLIVASYPEALAFPWESFEFQWSGAAYRFKGASASYPAFFGEYFYAVVPDKAVETMETAVRYMAYQTENKSYDVDGLTETLDWIMADSYGGTDIFESVDFRFQELMRRSGNAVSAMLVVGALVCSLVFLFMAMAVLALKTLSGVSEDRRRYRTLYRLGAGEREQRKTLFFQTFSFFTAPFGAALLVNIPVAVIFRRIIELGGLEEIAPQVNTITGGIAAAMTIVYLLYYMAAYLTARRAIVAKQ